MNELQPHEVSMLRVLLHVLTGGKPENDLEKAFIETVFATIKDQLKESE
jgi:hypothetical protein